MLTVGKKLTNSLLFNKECNFQLLSSSSFQKLLIYALGQIEFNLPTHERYSPRLGLGSYEISAKEEGPVFFCFVLKTEKQTLSSFKILD